ncbi:MAG TPA: LysM peptidoglycan-binding domain-containing protein [Anaerolineae bacterium]|nr:LysM peptidoglycan-binding domain-containing protein [Anaerolineae bacterium]
MHRKNERGVCAGCGTLLAREQLICPECGAAAEPERLNRCRHCGTLNRRGQRRCIACEMWLAPPWLATAGTAAALLLFAGLLVVTGPWLRTRLAPAGTPVAAQPAGPTREATAAAVAPAPTSLPPTATASAEPVASATTAATPLPSATSTRAPDTPAPTTTTPPTPTATPSPTGTSSPTDTASPTATDTPSPTPTASATPSPTRTPTRTPTATPTQPTAGASPTPFIYVVKQGDNLYDISLRFGVTVAAIKQANGLTSNNLRVGQQLIIPLPTPTPTSTPTPA